ncbi:MAG: hypothetical protein PHT02_00995 [Tissierellia bacterium]|nr:hypothetical protein [Tissierellia bacterium]
MIKNLSEADNCLPFTGKKKVDFEVICANPKIHKMYFSEGSIFCKKEEDYYTQCAELNITPNKKYKVIELYGVGDLFDIIIEKDDNGNSLEIMDAYFRDIENNHTKY